MPSISRNLLSLFYPLGFKFDLHEFGRQFWSSQQVKDRVKDGAQVGRAWPPTRPGCRQVRGDPGPGGAHLRDYGSHEQPGSLGA